MGLIQQDGLLAEYGAGCGYFGNSFTILDDLHSATPEEKQPATLWTGG
jgi:hypothetical protein